MQQSIKIVIFMTTPYWKESVLEALIRVVSSRLCDTDILQRHVRICRNSSLEPSKRKPKQGLQRSQKVVELTTVTASTQRISNFYHLHCQMPSPPFCSLRLSYTFYITQCEPATYPLMEHRCSINRHKINFNF